MNFSCVSNSATWVLELFCTRGTTNYDIINASNCYCHLPSIVNKNKNQDADLGIYSNFTGILPSK